MFYEVIGWIGTLLVVLAYFLLSSKRMAADTKLYQWMNILGAVLIGINSAIHRAIPSVATNVIWIGIGLYGLFAIKKNT